MPTSGPLKIGGQIPSKSSKPSDQEGRILPIKRSFASTVMLRGLQPLSPSWLGNSTEAFTSEIVSLGQKYFKTRLKRLEHRQGMTGTSSSAGYNTHIQVGRPASPLLCCGWRTISCNAIFCTRCKQPSAITTTCSQLTQLPFNVLHLYNRSNGTSWPHRYACVSACVKINILKIGRHSGPWPMGAI